MPTYDFRCPDGHQFERFYRKLSDAQPQAECPTCGKMAERLISGGAGLSFKGSGFYLTDYGKNAHRTQGAGDAKKPDSTGGTGSTSKPDGKSSGSSGTSGTGGSSGTSGSSGKSE